MFDVLFASFFLCISFPLFVVIFVALLVSGEKSPIFTQKRIGFHASTFNIFIFKTMKDVADKTKVDYYVRKNDQRVTFLGKYLRISSLDELPQLVNILLGHMSFVVPRPCIDGHPYCSKDYPQNLIPRLSVPQGLTGLAQTSGRNLLSNSEKYEIDCIYASRIGFKTDFITLVKTFFVLFNFHQVFDT